MLIATDPLSLLFIGCFLFGFLFMVITALLGNLGHSGHSGLGHHVAIPQPDMHTGVHHVGGLHGHGIHVGHGIAHTSSGAVTKGSVPQQGQGNGDTFSLLSYINITSIVLFLLGFGFFGYVFHNTTSLILPLTLVLAALGGLLVAALILSILSRLFGDSEGETIQDVSDRTGLLGKVGVTIQENGMGEVLYISPGGMRKSIPARSVDGRRLERDQEVVVVNYEHGVAEVDTWDHFVNQDDDSDTSDTGATSDTPEMPINADELAKLRALLEESGRIDTKIVMQKDLQKE